MAEAAPLFTIIMPTRNQARWLEQALRSVLDQAVPGRVELVVFDALSTDGSAAILERYRHQVDWRRAADRGQVDAINRGLAEARGEIVAWLNSDDVYLPGALAQVRQAFAADPALDFVYGDALEIDEDGRILTPNPFTEDCVPERYFTSHNFICQPTLFMRRHVFARVGPLRDDLHWFMDYAWFGRMMQLGLRGRRLPAFLAANRDHPATKTNSGGLARWREALRVLAGHPGPPLPLRTGCWIYSLEYVIKALNGMGWAAHPAKPAREREWRERLVDRLNAGLMRLVAPRSRDDIARRYAAEIAPRGPTIEAQFRVAASGDHPAKPAVVPLAPELVHKYPQIVREMHDALREWLFPALPETAGRIDLLTQLLGTSIPEAMYLLNALHRSLAVAGDVCEFGVAQGATSALLANELRDTRRRLWLYDSFAGLPKPSPQDQLKDDIFRLGAIERYEGEMRCDQAEVEERLRRIGIARERVAIHAGFVEQTLTPATAPEQVAFAYVDFDFYAPIRFTLDFLDPRVPPGGCIMVDDYDFFSTGAKTAVDEFVARRGEAYEFTLPRRFAGAFCLLTKRA